MQYKRAEKILEKLINTANKNLDSRKSFTKLSQDAGFSGASKPSQFSTGYGQGSLPKLNTSKQNVMSAFNLITKNKEAPAENFVDLFNKISKITGLNRNYVTTLLAKEPAWKKIRGPYNHLVSPGGKQKFLNKDLTFKDVINTFNSRTKGGTEKITGFGPEHKIMDYARRHAEQGGNKIEWLVKPAGASGQNYTKAKFIYNDEVYDLNKLKNTSRKDKNFEEFYNVSDRRKKLLNQSDGILDPRTGKPTTFGKLMKDVYQLKGKKTALEI